MASTTATARVPVQKPSVWESGVAIVWAIAFAKFVLHLYFNNRYGYFRDESVDEVFRGCFGHPMGPLETADLIGVDTILYSVEVLYQHYADSKYRPCPLLKQMTDAGLHGRKTGRGFYTYES